MTETDRLRPNARPPRREGYGDEESCKSHRASVSRVLPNGSRLSCGANAGGRKRPTLRDLMAGAQTDISSEAGPASFKRLLDSRSSMFRAKGLSGHLKLVFIN